MEPGRVGESWIGGAKRVKAKLSMDSRGRGLVGIQNGLRAAYALSSNRSQAIQPIPHREIIRNKSEWIEPAGYIHAASPKHCRNNHKPIAFRRGVKDFRRIITPQSRWDSDCGR